LLTVIKDALLNMPYSLNLVVIGGIAHIPFIIAFFKIIEKRFSPAK
tara:strand:- start:1771 stop:1908 length:138 start_codon:yes stop_codon:yes gene_type:complete